MECEDKSVLTGKDLRVGNYVLKNGFPYRVTWHSLGFDFPPLEPILLTPEVLENCIFENTRLLALVWHGFVKRFAVIVNGGSIQYKLLYLHQLQNLYFALHGIELEINL